MQVKHHRHARQTMLVLYAMLTAVLSSSCQSLPVSSQIHGTAFDKQPLAQAQITLVDASGNRLQTTTNAQGEFSFAATDISAPLLLSVVSGGKAEDCNNNAVLRPICMAALVETLNPQQIANINPLTDRLVSDTAIAIGFTGPQQWVDAGAIKTFNSPALKQARHNMQQGFTQALQIAGVKEIDKFDPATYPLHNNAQLVELLSLLNHNRNYDNNGGGVGHTTLSDISFRPLVGLLNNGAYEPFDFLRARAEAEAIRTAPLRIFIVGDSTSAVYEQLRYPRMGWGQMLEQQFQPDARIKVVVGSRAGRSSRDFYNGRWFAQMENAIQPGDYVFINHGHNDQNCDAKRAQRGSADVKNLCTYPNSAQGQPQHPAEQPELSFYYSLQRYINIAQARGAIPVLFTPTARIKNARGEQTTPVAPSHLTRPKRGAVYAFTGDYSQTIKDLARAEQLALIDLEQASMEFANSVGEPGWRNYWLVVDKSINPFYNEAVAGSTQLPDGTHFQKNGAEVMAKAVAELIKQDKTLQRLAQKLK